MEKCPVFMEQCPVITGKCCFHIETSQLICIASQLTGFYECNIYHTWVINNVFDRIK